MSIFNQMISDVCFALNKKKMQELKNNQIRQYNSIKKIVELNSQAQNLVKQNTSLNNKLIESLDKHNKHQQNLYAKKNGLNSAIQYKSKIKVDIQKRKQELEKLKQQQENYQNQLQRSQDELTKINNSILLFNNLKVTTFFKFIISALISLNYIMLVVKPITVFENLTNYLIYSFTILGVILLFTLIMFWFDKYLYKKLKLGRLNLCDYFFSVLLAFNLLLAYVPLNNNIKSYMIFVLFIFQAISMVIVMMRNEIVFKNNKYYCFALDFMMLNLPFISYTSIAVIDSICLNNYILSLIINVIYAISVFIYLILLGWEGIRNWNKSKDFKQYISFTASIILLLCFIFCAIFNFIADYSQTIQFMFNLASIVGVIAPFYNVFKKSPSIINSDKIKE